MSKWRKLLKDLDADQLSQLEELLKNPEADPDAISNLIGDVDLGGGDDKSSNVGLAGQLGIASGLMGQYMGAKSIAGATERQEETVDMLKAAAEKQGEVTETDTTARDMALIESRDDSEERSATIKELIDSGIPAAKALSIANKDAKSRSDVLREEQSKVGTARQTAEERAKMRRADLDKMATSAGLPIDEYALKQKQYEGLGSTLLGAEALMTRAGRTLQYADGGNLQTTQGPSDHSENDMLITNPDGSPAQDQDGNSISVTGKETIIPDWLMEMLLEAHKKSPEELSRVFKDEVVEEERFS